MVLLNSHALRDKMVQNGIQENTLLQKLNKFKPKISFSLEHGDYIVETAKNAEDLYAALALRQHSFIEDFLPGEDVDFIDFDEYDLKADHILVRDRQTYEVLGCYRVFCSKFVKKHYSESQFDLGTFLKTPGTKIELGRACIHKNHRNGVTLNLVWKGLAKYALLSESQYMFGCASIKTTSFEVAESIYWHLAPGFADNQYKMKVLKPYQFKQFFNMDSLLPWPQVEPLIPALLRTYLMAGAKICSTAALDNVFRCVDYITVLDLSKLDSKYRRRYFDD